MRLATILEAAGPRVAAIVDDRAISLEPRVGMRHVVASGGVIAPSADGVALAEVVLGPAIPDPGAIYTIGLNYRPADRPDHDAPDRPMVLGKVPTSVIGHAAVVSWDRALTANVDAECELGVVVGSDASVFGYTIVNDMNSADPWFDGDQWLLGKSLRGFCPVGPWLVTADELDPSDLRLGCTINGAPIQDGRTSQMRFTIPEVIAYLHRHVELRPGDLIATGTPARLNGPLGPERHLQPGDVVTCWIEGIGELTTTIA